ncbi:hypothetical protein [Azospirillum sp.]|uniref:hypothetical protein n=1 Tax=Azospirillum sp. TaxID=34012 RepID=UPI00260647DA|nr:hypothetical protein [Azospirillum sp.]
MNGYLVELLIAQTDGAVNGKNCFIDKICFNRLPARLCHGTISASNKLSGGAPMRAVKREGSRALSAALLHGSYGPAPDSPHRHGGVP